MKEKTKFLEIRQKLIMGNTKPNEFMSSYDLTSFRTMLEIYTNHRTFESLHSEAKRLYTNGNKLEAVKLIKCSGVTDGLLEAKNYCNNEFAIVNEEELSDIFIEENVKEYVISILWQHKNDLTVIRLTASLIKNASSEHEALGLAISENAETAARYAMNMYLITEID